MAPEGAGNIIIYQSNDTCLLQTASGEYDYDAFRLGYIRLLASRICPDYFTLSTTHNKLYHMIFIENEARETYTWKMQKHTIHAGFPIKITSYTINAFHRTEL